MTRREFARRAALSGAALSFASGAAESAAPLILISQAEARKMKAPAALDALRVKRIRDGPWSVTFHRPGALSEAGPHDFFSEGPYWWPDPKKPGGPYIRRDGEVNPERFVDNDRDLGTMSEAVMTLGLAARFKGDKEAAERAWNVLDVWFLDPKTRMNPNLEFGQAIRGVTAGRGIGIIDTRPLIWCVAGAALIEDSFPDKEKLKGLKTWFGSYVDWLTKSSKGLDEKKNGNNHSTWWAAQVTAFSIFCGDSEAEKAVYRLHREYLVPQQLRPDGSAPAEEARTRSLSYSAMNLDGFALLCRMARIRGEDLWTFRTQEGAGVMRSVEYSAPFAMDPSKWTKQQITPADRGRGYFLGLAGLDTGRAEWIEAQRRIGFPGGAWGVLYGMLLEADGR